MLSQTRHALEAFDNQHDFERLAADVLNHLGYDTVEPMAPGGGADQGVDIRFREGDVPGMAFVTLDKNVRDKFRRDLDKHPDADGVIALFCNADVSPSMKLALAREAIAKGYRLEVFDCERLRSLLDSSLKDVRRRYLKLDDEMAARLRSEATRLLRFPGAASDASTPPVVVERLLVNKIPCRMFELLMRYEEQDVVEVPGIGPALHQHLVSYYRFRQDALQVEDELVSSISGMVSVRFQAGWQIYLEYVLMRFGGVSKDAVVAGGDFLNYDITWDDAERVYGALSRDGPLSSRVSDLFGLHKRLGDALAALVPNG
jgi:hypothetical protein